jgi:lantibiotic modifying enzyme
VTGDEGMRSLAQAAGRTLRLAAAGPGQPVQAARNATTTDGIGAAFGLGSIAYSLFAIGRFLDEASLTQDALRAALLCTEEMIAADTALDVLGGSAGYLLACLPIYQATGDTRLGELLGLAARRAPRQSTSLQVGFGHGPAGLATAFARFHAAGGGAEWRDAALAQIQKENAFYHEALGHWPDPRYEPGSLPRVWGRWCGGTAGIGIGRLAAQRCSPHPDFDRDARRVVDFTVSTPPGDGDLVCCGAFGGLDFLTSAAHDYGRPELLTLARDHATAIALEARANGHYRLHAEGNSIFHPSFFRGVSGIGYQFLRLLEPERVPSVLAWE